MSKIEMVTFNANGLGDYAKCREVFNYFHAKNFDIVFLQETHTKKESQKRWSTEWGQKIWFDNGDINARGVAILFTKKLDIEVHNVITSDSGRYIILYFSLQKLKFVLANVYAPNKDNPLFIDLLFKEVTRFSPDHVIIAGDFNLALDLDMDRKGSYCNNNKAAKCLASHLTALDLFDAWRRFHVNQKGFTWRRMQPTPIFSRLDYIFTSETMAQFIDSIQIKYGYRSDHSMVYMSVSINPSQRGPGYWKLNNSLLKDPEYLDKVNTLLDIELGQEFTSYHNKWEMIKLAIQGTTLQYSARKQKSKRNLVQVLSSKTP